MEEIEGKIVKLKQNPNNHFLTIDKVDYSGYGECVFDVGDTVKIKFEVNGQYKNIKEIEMIKKATVEEKQDLSGRYTDEELKAIHKKDCLNISGQIVGNMKDTNNIPTDMIADKVVDLAEKIQEKAYNEKK